ncbi:hypothetical protein SAMN05518865_107239 [Duganella sp. CF458]|uniref:hypothetical protein n=1 Tax=Duganella sp. CF458 TaxID=1884368 RepID=UPI0008EAD838|nr:hypothetical protein [Duganella sp. CF458]SFG03684.1 hypothetical protein SAMN05518865_107239 [Duganella sp. CF458]
MQARLICLGMAGLVLAIAAACGSTRSTAEEAASRPAPRTSASYVLAPGELITLAPAVTLKLERVNDSRCKQGAVCVWAGYVSYSFVLTDQKGNSSFVLAEDMPGASKTVTRNGLTFTLLGMEPAEPPSLKAPAPDYRVSLRVNISQPT